MFGTGFDLFIAAVCTVFAVLFFLGKGKGILDMFSGGRKERKRTKEEQRKYEFGFGVFCLVLAAGQLLVGLVHGNWTGLAGIIIAAADLIFIGWYVQRH